MVRALVRTVLILIVVVGLVAFFLGYRWGNGRVVRPDGAPVGTIGRDASVDTSKARETGAKVGEKVAVAANEAGDAIADGQLTMKIKSKMTLDDLVQARTIDVDTRDGHVTLTGRVRSESERQRALQLARETKGVKNVVDRLVVEAR
jgi:osmotically-inducible protein OsmY